VRVKGLRLVILLFFPLVYGTYLSGATIYVDAGGPNDPGTGTHKDPYRRIQDAIYSAGDYDVVEVRPGIYTGAGNYNLDPNGRSVTLESIAPEDSNIVANTVINPAGMGRGFYIYKGEQADCVISGFTIKGSYTDGSGGGICCIGSSPVIRNCVIFDNFGLWGGGGVYCYNSSVKLLNCVLSSNRTNASGGAVKYSSCEGSQIVNSTICSNTAGWDGDGIYSYDSNAVVVNSVLWANGDEQIYVEGNIDVNFCDIDGGWEGGTGNISEDPCFVRFEGYDDPNLWDFHLQSKIGRWDPNLQSWVNDSNTSACIDAGDTDMDWSAEPWPNGKRLNMGSYGATAEASKNGNIADFDVSGLVDFLDYADFADKWGSLQDCIENLNNQGDVNNLDLEIFTKNWLWQK